MMQKKSILNYEFFLQKCMRSVVRLALEDIAQHGIVGKHLLYITYVTHHPEVHIPQYLKAAYTDTMTIILQHQFYDLKVDHDSFHVSLHFSGIPQRLTISYGAITHFSDPSVQFGLDLKPLYPEKKEKNDFSAYNNVVSLEMFRKNR